VWQGDNHSYKPEEEEEEEVFGSEFRTIVYV
jgi:hypothetical protein